MNMQSVRGFEYGVIHCRPEQDINLVSFIEKQLGGFSLSAQELLNLGSVYVNHNRITEEMNLSNSDYVRIHRKPRRFATENIHWSERIVFENENFLMLNKPAGIPCHPTVDNIEENILTCLKKSVAQNLFVTHRLDVPTQGLLIMAKNKESQTRINFAFSQRQIKKKYQAWSSSDSVNLGLHEHHMIKSPRAPKILVNQANENTDVCQLIIRNSSPLENGQEYEIELLTGRTHQIRAQMSTMGAAILGDTLYGGATWNMDPNAIALWSWQLEIPQEVFGEAYAFTLKDPKLKNTLASRHS